MGENQSRHTRVNHFTNKNYYILHKAVNGKAENVSIEEFKNGIQIELFKHIETEKNERTRSIDKNEEAIKSKNLCKEIIKDYKYLCLLWQGIFKGFLITTQTIMLKNRLLSHLRYKFTGLESNIDCNFISILDNKNIKSCITQYYDDEILQPCIEKYEWDAGNENLQCYRIETSLLKKYIKHKDILSGDDYLFQYDVTAPAKYYYTKNIEGLRDIKFIATIYYTYDDTYNIESTDIKNACLESISYYILQILDNTKYMDNSVDLISVIDEELPKMIMK